MLLAAFLGSISCGGDDVLAPPPGIEPTLTSIQTSVFTPSCALPGCHAPPSPQRGMDLSEGMAHANVVNVPSGEQPQLNRVTPANPNDSYLYMKVTGDPRILGSRMPRGAAPLTSEALEAIRSWIESGALDN